MEDVNTSNPNAVHRRILFDPNGSYAPNFIGLSPRIRAELNSIHQMSSIARKLEVIDELYYRENIKDDPYLLLVKSFLHLQLYHERSALKLMKLAQSIVAPARDPLVDAAN